MYEKSYVAMKPGFTDEVVIQEVMNRLLNEGLTILTGAFVQYTPEDCQVHYAEHFRGSYENAKPFYPELEEYMSSGLVYGMVVVGEDAISKIRAIVGGRNPEPGTIRHDIPKMLGQEVDLTKNVIHASSCPEDAENEIELFKKLSLRKRKVETARTFFKMEYEEDTETF